MLMRRSADLCESIVVSSNSAAPATSSFPKGVRQEERHPRGRRAGLDLPQTTLLFTTFVNLGAPWTAVLFLIQLALGERVDAMTKLKFGWFQNMNARDPGAPQVSIPHGVNGKTKARETPLCPQFADLLNLWMSKSPLKGKGEQWPLPGQPQAPQSYAFPGFKVQGRALVPQWSRHVSSRAVLSRFRQAPDVLVAQRAEFRRRKDYSHPFQEYDLSKLGTHSCKRGAVSSLKEFCSTAVVAQITGTTTATLDHFYDEGTAKRQRQALQKTFGGLYSHARQASGSFPEGAHTPAHASEEALCATCRAERQDKESKLCQCCSRPL